MSDDAQIETRRTDFVSFEQLLQEATQSVEQELSLEDKGWMPLGTSSWQVISPNLRINNVKASRLYSLQDPLASQSIRLHTDYTFGTGMSSMAKDKSAQKILEEYWNAPKNRAILSANGQRKSCKKGLIDGDVFFVLYLGISTNIPTIRWIDPLEITEIISDPNDRESVMFYRRVWFDPQGQSHETIYRSHTNIDDIPSVDAQRKGLAATDDGIVFHLALNTNSQWGNPLLVSALDWLRQYRKFLAARIAINQALARFAWRLKVKGGQAAVDAQRNKLNQEDGAPEAGSTIAENEGVDMTPIKTDSGAKNAEADAKLLKLQIFAAAGFPETYYGDVDAGNLATAKTAELPVIKMIQSEQQVWEDLYEDIDNAVLAHRKVSPDKWYVDRNWPPISPRDASEFAKAITEIVGAFPPFGTSKAVMQAALSSLGIDDTAEVIEELEKIEQEEEAKGNPDVHILKLTRVLKEYMEGRQKE